MAAPQQLGQVARVFSDAGFATLAPGWPDDPETVAEGNAHPEVFARKTVGQVADHLQAVIGKLTKPPALIGHSFGGLLVQILAGRSLAKATVAIDPAPFRGVLPLPISALKSASPVLKNPANRSRSVALTYEQFRYAFANAVECGGSQGVARDGLPYPVPAARSFRRQAPTSTHGPMRRWTPRIRSVGRCC